VEFILGCFFFSLSLGISGVWVCLKRADVYADGHDDDDIDITFQLTAGRSKSSTDSRLDGSTKGTMNLELAG